MTTVLPYLGRLVALGIAWLVMHFGIQMTVDQQQAVAENIVNIVTILIGVYAVSHKTLNKFINPGDTASSTLAKDDQTRKNVLKARESLRR